MTNAARGALWMIAAAAALTAMAGCIRFLPGYSWRLMIFLRNRFSTNHRDVIAVLSKIASRFCESNHSTHYLYSTSMRTNCQELFELTIHHDLGHASSHIDFLIHHERSLVLIISQG